MNEEWICAQLESLKIKENRLSTLSELRVQLNASPSLEASVTNRLLAAPEIYDCCLDDEDTESGGGGVNNTTGSHDGGSTSSVGKQLDIASDVLAICMANLSIGQSNLPQLLQRALRHQRPQIRALALRTILKELQRDAAIPPPSASLSPQRLSDDLLLLILDTLQQHETQVGVPALNILSLALEHHLDEPPVRDALVRMLACDETIKCRVYELSVNLAKRSPGTLNRVEHLLDRALAELGKDDILFQVNILEILVPLAEQNHGLLYLEKRQVFEVIGRRVEQLEQNPMDQLLVPGIMKFFGKVASVQPQKIIAGYPHMIQCLLDCLHSGDATMLPTAFDTFANLAQTQQGKLLLEQHYGGEMRRVFEDYAVYMRNLSTDIKRRAFSSLEVIFTSGSGSATQEISEVLRKWFAQLAGGNRNMQFLLDFCRNPFPDIKVASLSLTRTLCAYTWGVLALRDTGGFLEFLLDRKIEFDKEAKFAKFEVIRRLADCADQEAFDVQTKAQLRTYINEGPYFVQAVMEVAVEGSN